jgi:hypothetical protein
MLANSPQAADKPPLSNNAHSPTTTSATVAVRATIVVSHNNRPPNPYKWWEDWNYCHSHGGDVGDNHTSAPCGKPGPMHNPNATRTNIMGGSVATRMHKTILPSTSGRTPPNCHPQQQQHPQ